MTTKAAPIGAVLFWAQLLQAEMQAPHSRAPFCDCDRLSVKEPVKISRGPAEQKAQQNLQKC